MSERQDLADVFRSLSPDAQAAALVYGVVEPHVCTASQVAGMLDHTLDYGDDGWRGRRMSNARLRDANREIAGAGLAFAPRRGAGLRASPRWAPWLTMEAHRRGLLDRIVAGHGQVHSRHPYWYDEARATMELRCHTVAGRFTHIHGDRIGPEGWGFLAEPGAAELLHTLPEAWRDRALSGCLMHVIRSAAPPEPIIDACRELGSDLPAFAADIAFIRILQGRLDEVDAVFDALPSELRDGKRARTGHAGARALVATLRGDDGEACRLIEAAVAEERAGTRKRNVFPSSPGFALSLLSLVRDDSPASRTLLAQLLRTARQRDAEPLILHYVGRAFDLRRGTRLAAMMFPAPEFGALLQGLECCWVGQFGQYAEPTPCQALAGYASRARSHGFAWALAECLAVMGQPDLEMAEGRTGPAAAYREEAAAMHARLGTRSLASLLAPMADWEYPLKALEELAFETRSKPAAAKKRGPSTRRRRLVWELGEDFGEIVAKAREQHQYKNGTWSAGRPISMKRLATSAASLDFLLERDRAAAAKIKQSRDWDGRRDYYMDGSGLFELAGHPHVFGESGAPMEVVQGEPELVVDEHEMGLLARLVPEDADFEDYHVRLVDERRCEVTRFTRGHKRLRAIIPEGGLELPAAARARLLDAVSALASEVRIHGGIAGGAGRARLGAPARHGGPRAPGLVTAFAEGTALDADAGWRAQRERLRDAAAFEPELPSTLKAELRPYQRDGFRWLARLARWGAGACLADDMGLGKTVQTLALLLDRAPGGPALVVAPTSVVANWLDEARRFAPTLNAVACTGSASSRARLIERAGPFDVIVTTYGLLQNDAGALSAIDWHSAVLDEAQAIKNPATKRARAARDLKAGFRLVTTGTPIQNNLMDLYSLFGFANPGMLGSTEHYRRHFASPIERDADPAARARLRRLIAPFVLRRLKTEVLDDLPPRTEITLHVELSPAEAALYEALRQRAVEDLAAMMAQGPGAGAGEGRLEILAHLTRLRLACCNPRLVQDGGGAAPASSKLATFAETLDELLANRHKVLVFSQFVMHLKLIEEHLAGAGRRLPVPRRLDPGQGARRAHRGLPGGAGRRLPHLAQGGRDGAQPHRRRLRDPHGPVVEPGRRGPGIGPRPPHRPDPPGDDLPPGGEGDHRGADRRPAPPQARPRRAAP